MSYTMEELKTQTDKQFVLQILLEKKAKCTNYYTPLSIRLKTTIARLEEEDFGKETGIVRRLVTEEKKISNATYENTFIKKHGIHKEITRREKDNECTISKF